MYDNRAHTSLRMEGKRERERMDSAPKKLQQKMKIENKKDPWV